MNRTAPYLILLLTLTPPATAETEAPAEARHRWLPESCRLALDGFTDDRRGETAEALWNRVYREGLDASVQQDTIRAEIAFCRALRVARSFGPEDVRFAETLDELGLVFYVAGNLELSEAMQGAAVTERLLAVGAPEGGGAEATASACISSVGTYVARLGWILERQGRQADHDPLVRAPYRILERRYVPDRVVLTRIDDLIATYLLLEDYSAADWLTAWRDELRAALER